MSDGYLNRCSQTPSALVAQRLRTWVPVGLSRQGRSALKGTRMSRQDAGTLTYFWDKPAMDRGFTTPGVVTI